MFTKGELRLLHEVLSCRIMDCDDVLSDKAVGQSEKDEWSQYKAELIVLQKRVEGEMRR